MCLNYDKASREHVAAARVADWSLLNVQLYTCIRFSGSRTWPVTNRQGLIRQWSFANRGIKAAASRFLPSVGLNMPAISAMATIALESARTFHGPRD